MCRCSCAPRMPGAVRPHDRYALAPAARGTLEQNSCRLSGAGSADCALPVPPLTAHALGMCLSSSGSCARSRGGTRTTSATSWRSTVSSCCVCVCHGSFLDPWWVDCLATAWQPDWPRPAQQVSYPLCSALASPAPFASPSQRFLFDHPSICCGLCGVQGSSWMTCATSGIRTCRQRCLGFRLRSSPTATSGSSAPWICL